jgi:hypothetical protein
MLKKLSQKGNITHQGELRERVASTCSSDCHYWCITNPGPHPYPGKKFDIILDLVADN